MGATGKGRTAEATSLLSIVNNGLSIDACRLQQSLQMMRVHASVQKAATAAAVRDAKGL